MGRMRSGNSSIEGLIVGVKRGFIMGIMNNPFSTSRREFLKTSAIAGGALMAPAILRGQAGDQPTLKIGLVGCGGRGTGAASQALHADKNVVLTAMADVFEDKLK